MHAPELDKKITISIAALASIVAATFILSGTIVKVLDNDTQREAQRDYLEKQLDDTKSFLLDEISGLRSDWERQYQQDINKRIDKLEEKIENLK